MPIKRKLNPYRWHIISMAQLPRWVKKKWGVHPYEKQPNEDQHFASAYVTEQPHYHVKGRHYEYKETIVETRGYLGSATHDSVIVKRKLKPQK